MIDVYSTLKESGLDYAKRIAEDLKREGKEIIAISQLTEVPRGCDRYGNPTMVPGYKIIIDDGRPPYVSIITGELVYRLDK